MEKKKSWIHLWGDTYIPKTNLLIALGLLIALFFVMSFFDDITSFILAWIFIVLFIIFARMKGTLH